MTKRRRHHNNKAYRKIKRGKVARSLEIIARRVGVPYGIPKKKKRRKIDNDGD